MINFQRSIRVWGTIAVIMGGLCARAACPISNESSAFGVTVVSSNNFFALSFESCTDHIYFVYATDVLTTNAPWPVVASMRGEAGTTTWVRPPEVAAQKFYRVLRVTDTGDPDEDGYNNFEESLLGTDPVNLASRPGSYVRENLATNLIYVAVNGSDANPGNFAAPYRTIQQAANVAKVASQAGMGSEIIILPGTYRESISLVADSGNLVAPVVFSAAINGTVTISGADVWTNGWSPAIGSSNVYQHTWTNNWGLSPLPAGWPALADIVRRREIVFANGVLLTQVLSRAGMSNGTFFVDDANSLLYVQNRAGVVPGNAFYEVAQRSSLLDFESVSGYNTGNVVLRGLEFRACASPVAAAAVRFANAANILVDQCTLDWNNWSGMSFSACNGITVRDSAADHNGAMGIEVGYREKNIVVDGVETSFNNWRGSWGGFYGFSIAGIKALNIHTGLFRNHVGVGNATYGLWLDFDNKNILIENCVYNVNRQEGLQLEATQGPVRIQQCVSSRDTQANFALLMQNVQNVTVLNCAFNGSETNIGSGDIGCSVAQSRAVTDWETGKQLTLLSSNWCLLNNSCRSKLGTQYGVYMQNNFTGFLSTLISDSNHWYNAGANPQFYLGGGKYSLADWQSLSGQDAHSDAANVLVTNVDVQDTYFQTVGTAGDTGSTTNGICATLGDGTGMFDITLLKFNLAGLTNAPRSVELQLAANLVVNGPVVFHVYRLTSDWSENATATQAKPNSNLSWAGGAFSVSDYDPQPAGTGVTGVGPGYNTFVDITALAQGWVNNPNYGVVIVAQPLWSQPVPEGSNLQQFGINTREAVNFQPQLTIISR